MKSKILKFIVPCTASLICLAGCGHQHTYDTKWSTNDEKHWHDATCEHKGQVCSDLGDHVDNDGDLLCDVCGYQLGHIHTPDAEWHTDKFRHWHVCTTCGEDCNMYWHEDNDDNGYCDLCGYELEYNPDIGTYYDRYDTDLIGADLEHELQKICFETHTVYVKYSQYSDYASFTGGHISSEAAPSTVNTSKQNEYFYTGKIASGVGTREHVWPCANSDGLWVHDKGAGAHYVDGTNYAGGGSDLYHIRPSSPSVNTARGNSKFCDFDDPEFKDLTNIAEVGDGGRYKLKIEGYEKTQSGQYQYANKAEVADEYKGDIARILVYVWIHYAYRGNYYNHQEMLSAGLSLTNVLAYGSPDRTYEKLCEWNMIDPPSETEILRNKTVQKMQGNRNPFVDYPELMNNLFGF